MTGGKIDFKAHAEETADRYRSFFEVTKMNVVDYQPKADVAERSKERARLEREVVEAAKAERAAAKDYDRHLILINWRRFVDTRQARESAIDALLEFESQQK